jgi:hypothetical protein
LVKSFKTPFFLGAGPLPQQQKFPLEFGIAFQELWLEHRGTLGTAASDGVVRSRQRLLSE